ncbi:hypothetical protein HPB52_017248 [Rhipicephalus sanguineus]|uniref:Uncharacterized protein n=1 Tax=Rhipicephalus sanguineus TaxID=34632 RepID=A0A9D4TB23_RHISA|nr:hypothetical protein HPB52_017248 [Rhipicephalus sanguineus]
MSRLKRDSEPTFHAAALQAETKNRRLPYIPLPERHKCSSSRTRLHEWGQLFLVHRPHQIEAAVLTLMLQLLQPVLRVKTGEPVETHMGAPLLLSCAVRHSALLHVCRNRSDGPCGLTMGKKSKGPSIEPAGLRQ